MLKQPPQNTKKSFKQKFFVGSSLILAGSLIAQILRVVLGIWIARELGPSDYGTFAQAVLLVTILLPLSTLGFSNTLLRFIPTYIGQDRPDKVKGAIVSSLIFILSSSFLVSFLVFSFADIIASYLFNNEGLGTLLKVFAVTIPLNSLSVVAMSATKALQIMIFDAIGQVLVPAIRLILWVAAILLGYTLLNGAVGGYLVGFMMLLVFSLGSLIYCLREFSSQPIHWELKPLFLYSLPIVFSTLLYTLLPRIDRLIVGSIATATNVGVYMFAVSFPRYVLIVRRSLVTVFVPMVSNLYNRNKVQEAIDLYKKMTSWDTKTTFILCLSMILFGKDILNYTGSEYLLGLPSLLIITLSIYVGTLVGPTGGFLMVTGKQSIEAINATIMLVTSMLLEYFLGQVYGIVGVAFGVLLSAILLNLIQIIEIWKFYSFHPFQSAHRKYSILSFFTLCVASYFSYQSELVIRIGVFLLVSIFFVIYLVKAEREDLLELKDLIFSRLF